MSSASAGSRTRLLASVRIQPACDSSPCRRTNPCIGSMSPYRDEDPTEGRKGSRTREELSCVQEMAALAALDVTLDLFVTTRALFAAHPELCEGRIPRYKLVALIQGHRLLNLSGKTQIALARYRQAVPPDRVVPPD